MAVANKLRTQFGVSLITLMIGLFISMLCILASLTLYKNLVHVAAENKLETLFDGQIATALMVAQKEIQNTGYGIVNSTTGDIEIRSTGAAGGTDAKIELLWRYQDGTTAVCQGLIEETATLTLDGETYQYRQLALQTVASGCDITAALTSFNWTQTTILARWHKVGSIDTYLTSNSTLLSFAISTKVCSPYGSINSAQHLQLTVTVPSSTSLNTTPAIAKNTINLCLPNTYPT